MALLTLRRELNFVGHIASDTLALIVGKAKNLRNLNFETTLKNKLGDSVTSKLWSEAIAAIPKTGSASIPLHLNSARIIAVSDEVSRHNAPSNAFSIFKEVKNMPRPEGVKKIFVTLCADYADVYASIVAISKCFPLYDSRTNVATPLESVEIEVIISEKDKSLTAADIKFLQDLCDSVRVAAKLTDIPCNLLHSEAFADEAVHYVGDLDGVKTTIIKGNDLLQRGFGGIYNVGKAATHPPVFVCFSYEPLGATKTVALVGKGIVYDSGGMTLKGRTIMPGMKQDMGGAAGMLSTFYVLVKSGFKQNLHCLLCIAENMIGPGAMRPDDIITLLSGRNVEVNNTDAEGRLVLADGVFYAKKFLKAETIIDMATLTGAQRQATGKMHAAVLTNSEEWEQKACEAGRFSGDLVHPLPFCPDLHFSDLKSPVADMRNANLGKMQGPPSSVAGLFIGAQIDFGKDIDWLHIDFAHLVENGERATGYGPSLICALLKNYFDVPILKN
uniref:CYTOSOL_AP domain-containing protein n=1 Tax=Syphacia muris TaxID=451379 RepID=A0A0N5B0L0_9BILA